MSHESRELLFATSGFAVSRTEIVTTQGTFAVRQIANVRASYTQDGRPVSYALGAVGLLLVAGAMWIGDSCFAFTALLVLSLAAGAFFMRPRGSLYLTPTGDSERMVARGSPEDVAAAVSAIERAVAG